MYPSSTFIYSIDVFDYQLWKSIFEKRVSVIVLMLFQLKKNKSQKPIYFEKMHKRPCRHLDKWISSKILQRTLLRGGDCNLGWSWKKISLQCPELGLWAIPGETGLVWEKQTSGGDRRAEADTPRLWQTSASTLLYSFHYLRSSSWWTWPKKLFSSPIQVLMCHFSI